MLANNGNLWTVGSHALWGSKAVGMNNLHIVKTKISYWRGERPREAKDLQNQEKENP